MAKQRIPRRLLVLVRYLEGVLRDPKSTASMKSVAAGRLVEVLLSSERTKERAAIATERAQARAREAKQGKPSPEPDGQLLEAPDANAHAQNDADVKASVNEYLSRFTKTA
jgi:hypothetical protein